MNSIIDAEYFIIRNNESIFQTTLSINPDREFDRVCVLSMSIPKTFYVLPHDAILKVTENGNITNVLFHKGNYDLNSFKSVFEQEMKVCQWSYTMSYPARLEVNTNKFTFNVGGNHHPIFYTTDKYLANIMGLEKDVNYTFDVNHQLVSVNVLNFQAYDEIKLLSDIVKNKNSLLQEIYSNGEPYGTSILFQNWDILANAKLINNIGSNIYEFKLLDSEDNVIDLNGSEFSFTLMLFKTSNLDTIIKNFISLLLLEKDKDTF
jgi:hypothetical protein